MKYTINDIALSERASWQLKLILDQPLNVSFMQYSHIAKWMIEESLSWMLTEDGKLQKVTLLMAPIMNYWIQEEFEHLYPEEIKDYLYKLLTKKPDHSIGEAEHYLSRKIEINKALFRQYLELSKPLSYKINTQNYRYNIVHCKTGFEWSNHEIYFKNRAMEICAFNKDNSRPGVTDKVLVRVENRETRTYEEPVLYSITEDRMEFVPTYNGEALNESFIIKKIFLDQKKNDTLMQALDLISIAEKHNLKIQWSLD